MRLDEHEVDAITEACRKSFGQGALIWLYGSRVNDDKKGGDIDLFVEVDPQSNVVKSKLNFYVFLEKKFGDQKMDVLVYERNLKEKPFHQMARRTGIRLN